MDKDNSLLLIKIVTLLYLETKAGQSNNSKGLCKLILDEIKIPEASVESNSVAEVIVSLRDLVLWLMTAAENGEVNKNQLLQRTRVSVMNNDYLYHAIESTISKDYEESELLELILSYRSQLKDHMANIEIKRAVNEAYKQTKTSTPVNYRDLVREIYAKLEPYTHGNVNDKHPSIVDSVSINDPEQLEKMLERAEEELSVEGILKTGWQAINRMTGSHNGFRRGEMVVVGALQHNFKTGFTLNLFKHLALYNKPYMRDPSKKPLLIHFSNENDMTINISYLYRSLYENEYGIAADVTKVTFREAADYIKSRMGATGYHIEMMRLNPDETTFYDMFDIMSSFEAKGYEIHGVVCDYLSMLSKKGLPTTGAMGTDIRALFRLLRNYCSSRGILFITPHQLSTDAKGLVRQGVENFVQEIANKGYYEGSKQIDQEVDMEIYIHIEKVKNVGSFLTVQRGKHRKSKSNTPEKDLYTVLPFQPVADIPDDLNGEDRSLSSVGGSRGSDGSELDVFDM